MERIDARPTRPLHPLTTSRETAVSPRARENSLVISTTEQFRTGTEGLFTATRMELGKTMYHMPSVRLQHQPNESITVAIASNNNIKVSRMKELVSAHNVDVVRIPEAAEWHTRDSVIDATSKAIDAANIILTSEDVSRRDVRTRPHVTMATDQLNSVPVIAEDPITHLPTIQFERLGKPSSEGVDPRESVRQTFQQLATLAHDNHWAAIPYIIELATVIHNPKDPHNNAVSVQKSAVFLSTEGMMHLATDRFEEYLQRVGETRFDIANISGGLELKVLEEMGMIQLVSGTAQEVHTVGFPPEQRPEAHRHAYSLALGHADEKLVRDYFTPAETN